MACAADRFQIAVRIRATTGELDDVINLARGADPSRAPARLAQAFVALQDPITLAPPRPAAPPLASAAGGPGLV
ncbi:hypothetical protein PHACT_12610 [Pseudohongiella acticola]|uniref:Uncharacterized protein n=1 Tax=Pseudohongiella acticola TaxID=1524254 RepID=A0A1E8CG98_9GAMM|nr:hypothetical protein PHACT_12610 [Pseudohongiella acticola]